MTATGSVHPTPNKNCLMLYVHDMNVMCIVLIDKFDYRFITSEKFIWFGFGFGSGFGFGCIWAPVHLSIRNFISWVTSYICNHVWKKIIVGAYTHTHTNTRTYTQPQEQQQLFDIFKYLSGLPIESVGVIFFWLFAFSFPCWYVKQFNSSSW